MICEYGCGRKSNFKLANGKNCCSKSYNSCPTSRKKNSIRAKNFNTNNKIRPIDNLNIKHIKCKFCNKEMNTPNIKRHENTCYMNPKNIRSCPICKIIIKNNRNETCSKSCAKQMPCNFGRHNPNWKDDSNDYVTTCKEYHGLSCIICGEDKVFNVHHIDKDRTNNRPDNLVPLCPTHHAYMHKGFGYLIEEKITKFLKENNGRQNTSP
ncbi:MAG: HNH endonuclease [Candidatus Peribacteraceae bacterium]|nr:HNH endonuclease [Candidatus Peribacteraceae bacterium]